MCRKTQKKCNKRLIKVVCFSSAASCAGRSLWRDKHSLLGPNRLRRFRQTPRGKESVFIFIFVCFVFFFRSSHSRVHCFLFKAVRKQLLPVAWVFTQTDSRRHLCAYEGSLNIKNDRFHLMCLREQVQLQSLHLYSWSLPVTHLVWSHLWDLLRVNILQPFVYFRCKCFFGALIAADSQTSCRWDAYLCQDLETRI